jgi:hypothetical protein
MCPGLQSESRHLYGIRWGLETLCDGSEDKERMFTLESFRMWTQKQKISITVLLLFCPFRFCKFAEQWGYVI